MLKLFEYLKITATKLAKDKKKMLKKSKILKLKWIFSLQKTE